MSYWDVLAARQNPLDAFKWYNGGEKGFSEFLEGRNLSDNRELRFLGSLSPGMFLNNKGTSPYQIVEAGNRFIPPGYELVGEMPASTHRSGYGWARPNIGQVEGTTEHFPGYYIVQKKENETQPQKEEDKINYKPIEFNPTFKKAPYYYDPTPQRIAMQNLRKQNAMTFDNYLQARNNQMLEDRERLLGKG